MAAELLQEAGSSVRPGIKLPGDAKEIALAAEIATHARNACEIARLSHLLPEGISEVSSSIIQRIPGGQFFEEFGIHEVSRESSRFRSITVLNFPSGIQARCVNASQNLQPALRAW